MGDSGERPLAQRRVVVTGGGGFLGSYVLEGLRARGVPDDQIFVPRSADYDLRDRDAITRMMEVARPDLIIHLAAVVGGIGANRDNPGRFCYDNLIMGVQLIEYARRFGVEKFVTAGTICAYPKHTPVPFKEEDLWDGYPEETNAPYGLAKKMLLVQSQAYRAQYGMNAIYLLPVNLYGPRDDFDLHTSHVIPALIRKCLEAKSAGAPTIPAWGDGSPSREFLHARDAAEGILTAAARFDGPEPVNLGTGGEITIHDLLHKIMKLTGYEGEVVWETDKPNGQPRRCLDTSRAEALFGWRAQIGLDEGLEETIAWYRAERDAGRA